MQIHFLGGATTVTGSQYLLETGRARVLIDCGMFQGSPNEAMRNRVPLAYDPATVDVLLLTHAHLDHCGLIPHVVNLGYRGRVIATSGTCELAELVLLDSGKLQEEFAKRESRRFRTQERNREDARDRLAVLIRRAAEPPATRKRTRPRPEAKERRLESKRRRSAIKRVRGRVPPSEA